MSAVNADPWLDRWLPLITRHSPDAAALELGCGAGRDTAELVGAGCRVLATDISLDSLQRCVGRVPDAMPLQLDLGAPLPFKDGSFGVVVASLSLHYFPWRVTTTIASD